MARRTTGMSAETKERLRYIYPATVEFGSEQHAALLGLGEDVDMAPDDRAKREKALEAGEPPVVSTRQPINRHTYADEQEITAGFHRVKSRT